MSVGSRRLAAIMFTDMVGFSALAERDEALALRLLEEHRAILRPLFEQHSGREIKSMADGFLVEFASAVEAVRCAQRIQGDLAARNLATAPPIAIRIGIHVGDIIAHGDDVLGDGVNVAARIEKLADSGGICLSEDAYRQVRGKVEAEFESLGRPPLKNIEASIEVFRLSTTGKPHVPGPRADARRSVAVLPFANLSPDPENEYFSDGLTEDILTQLSRISELKVISRTSVMQYKGTTKNLRTIGHELGASTVLEGSVRRAGNQIRISAQLIDAAADEHLWAQTYDRSLDDIFAVQSDVAEQIAQALKARIAPEEEERLRRKPTANLVAYQLFLRARYLAGRRTLEGLQKAIECYEEALALDPQFAAAHAGVADAYVFLSLLEFVPPREAFPRAKAAAERALAIDPALAEAHASLGLVRFQFDWDWVGSETELRRAIDLNSNYAPGHHFYADLLKATGRFDEALEQIRIAQSLDPLSLVLNSGVGHVLYLSRRYDEAIAAYRHTLELDPNFLQARLWFGRPYLQKGMFAEAIAELREAVALSGGSTISLAVLGHVLASAGQRDEALGLLEQLRERAKEQYVPSYWIGLIYVGLGEKDQAVDWLERAREERSAWLAWVNVEPRFDSLRGEPRFQELARKIGF